MDDALQTLPTTLLTVVRWFCSAQGLDYTSSEAMHSQCENQSRLLAAHLDGLALLDDDGDLICRGRAWVAAAPREGDELAVGHVVAHVEWDMETWAIDLTDAQFGAAGPTCELIMG